MLAAANGSNRPHMGLVRPVAGHHRGMLDSSQARHAASATWRGGPGPNVREENAVEPIKIGWLGAALDGPGGGYDKIHRLAFDEATEAGLLDRPVEFVLHPENGLPEGSAKNATDGFRHLVVGSSIAGAGA